MKQGKEINALAFFQEKIYVEQCISNPGQIKFFTITCAILIKSGLSCEQNLNFLRIHSMMFWKRTKVSGFRENIFFKRYQYKLNRNTIKGPVV